MEHLKVDGTVIEYQVQGDGEPVFLIHPSIIADGLDRPLLAQTELASRYQLIHYHRRGWMGSTLGPDPLTIALLASDAAALMRHLGVSTAHVAGHSIGGLIALQLALDAPELVHSIALLEPPLRMAPSGKESFERVNLPMLNAYRSGNKRQALDIFADAVFGPNWQSVVEQAVPGGVEQAVKDVDTFIREQPMIGEYQFGPKEAAAIHQPVLSVLGLRSNQFMKEGRQLLHSWIPQTEDLDVNSTHLLQMQDPKGIARGLAESFARHPIMSNSM
ncbi:MAG: alpha/beta fold hydrolase [Acidobacteriota bacterium]